jgi:hypothetical protein
METPIIHHSTPTAPHPPALPPRASPPDPLPFWLLPLTISNSVTTLIALIVVLTVARAPAPTTTAAVAGAATAAPSAPTYTQEQVQQAAAQIIPKGKPFYGDELGISYDEAEKSITVLGQFDSLGSKPIKLTGEKLERYVRIGQSIACEYCCGAKVMTNPDGSAACGCAHSMAMRGVAAYLLDKYGDRSDQEIFNEVAKWKALSFPQDTVQAYLAQATGTAGSAASLPKQVGGC